MEAPPTLVAALLRWFAAEARDLPWRRTSDPYAVWISEIMLQQTQVRTVIPYWERWMRELPDVGSLARADEARILRLWEGLGYYRRARHLQAAAREIVERHGGRFPAAFEDVLALPGVGPYTAGAICSIAFNQPTPILDGNVIRVLTRLGAIGGDPRQTSVNRRLWREARLLVETAGATGEPQACSHLNQALMELGATVCLPQSPVCAACPVSSGCRARQRGRPEAFPRPTARPGTTQRWFIVIVAVHRGRFLVRRRRASEVNGGLWEFPNLEVVSGDADPAVVARRLFGVRARELTPLAVVRHAITRYRITQRAFRLRLGSAGREGARGPAGEWRSRRELEELAFTRAHRRIVEAPGFPA